MPLATSDIDFLRDLIAKQSGNVIAPRQVYMLEQRLAPMAKDMGLKDVDGLVAELKRRPNPRLSTQIAEAVTVNETSFFRDQHVFDALKTDILPELIAKNEASRSLRIWCAACSSGQEPHTLAIVIRENFPQLANWRIEILATDLSEEMLAKSSSGEYTQLEVNRGLPARKLVRFFERNGSVWRAKEELRSMIKHRRLNLTQAFPQMGQFDIVMIRNVLIYFDQPTKTQILKKIGRALRSDGYLFIGSAETLIGLGLPYQRQEINGTISYRPTN